MTKKAQKTKQPLFVAISDVHYSLATMDVADRCFRAAIDKAAELKVPLIDFGDLTNDKGSLRAEYVNKLIDTMWYAHGKTSVVALVGNHSLINEKGEDNALRFLGGTGVTIVSQPTELHSRGQDLFFIPYQSSLEAFRDALYRAPKDSFICMHQGVQGALMGDYIQDKSAVPAEWLKDYRWFSGHYHRHQEVFGGVYIGNPYTRSFGEAEDGPKGFLVVYTDGSFDRIILHERKHVVAEVGVGLHGTGYGYLPTNLRKEDLLWLKVHGAKSDLAKVKKDALALELPMGTNFRLDLIPTESEEKEDSPDASTAALPDAALFDALIDAAPETAEQKTKLKALWRGLAK